MTHDELLRKVESRFAERVPVPRPCGVCGSSDWSWNNTLTSIPMTGDPARFFGNESAQLSPMAVRVCGHCGNSVFINLLGLGLSAEEVSSVDDSPPENAIVAAAKNYRG